MSNFSRQIAEKKDRKERDKTRKEKLAGYFFDLSKLYMASVAIVSLSPIVTGESNSSDWASLLIGLSASVVFFLFGYRTLK